MLQQLRWCRLITILHPVNNVSKVHEVCIGYFHPENIKIYIWWWPNRYTGYYVCTNRTCVANVLVTLMKVVCSSCTVYKRWGIWIFGARNWLTSAFCRRCPTLKFFRSLSTTSIAWETLPTVLGFENSIYARMRSALARMYHAHLCCFLLPIPQLVSSLTQSTFVLLAMNTIIVWPLNIQTR